jgi:type IV secretion system protein TrbL
MNSTVLDQIVATFAAAIDGGFVALAASSLALLSVFGLISFYTHMPAVVMGGAQVGETLASFLWAVLRIGVFYWLVYHLYGLTFAAFLTFMQWGLAGTGGQTLTVADMLHPSTIIDAGFAAAYPIQQFIAAYGSGISGALNRGIHFWTVDTYLAVYWLVVLAFAFVAVAMILTLIEFKLAVMASAVLLPWGVLTHVAFISELSIAWIMASLVRVMLTTAIVGIGVPLFGIFTPNTTPGGDPTQYSSIMMVIVAIIFAILAWEIPKRAATIGGRGMALALGGDTLLLPAYSGVRMTIAAGTAAARELYGAGRSAVNMVQAYRAERIATREAQKSIT